MFAITMLAPVGKSKSTDETMPSKKHTTDTAPEQMTTLLKVLQTLIAVRDGKITRLDIKSAPIRRMPKTMISAVR